MQRRRSSAISRATGASSGLIDERTWKLCKLTEITEERVNKSKTQLCKLGQLLTSSLAVSVVDVDITDVETVSGAFEAVQSNALHDSTDKLVQKPQSFNFLLLGGDLP
jgi:hypothetical protein